MIKRAAIYVRVSSEKQNQKASPEIQEQECLKYCENYGYHVLDVYQDIKKYRSGGRLVEPSGRRNDRPQYKRMIGDIDTRCIHVVVAWKEDRLYRGVTHAMLEFSELVAQ